MPADANALLLNKTNLDSSTHGTGSGSDPTASGGAVVSVAEGGMVGIRAFFGQSDTGGEPGDADTLDLDIEVAVDGSTFHTFIPFRQVAGAELPDDTAHGDKTLRLGAIGRLPIADAGQSHLVKLRCNTSASDASNWGLRVDVVTPAEIRDEWIKNAQAT